MATTTENSRRRKRTHPNEGTNQEKVGLDTHQLKDCSSKAERISDSEKALANDSDIEQLLYKTLNEHMFVFDNNDKDFAFGDYGCTIMDNVVALWRKHFVLREKMEEVYFPAANRTWYVRPETPENTFTYLEHYFRCNEIFKLPYTAAQLTRKAVRCEESPRHCLVNVNESTFGEIEHFMELEDSSHPKFSEVSDLKFPMCSRDDGQTAPHRHALSQVIANNQTLAFFIGRVYLFLQELGIDKNRLRFMQLPLCEMTPDAADCWVVEIESPSYGWLICGRITHRSADACKKAVITPNKEELKDDLKTVRKALKALDYEKAVEMKDTLEQKLVVNFKVESLQLSLTRNMVSISTETITPSLIKLSLWIDQIILCVYEHSFYLRRDNENQQLCVFRFTLPVAPIKCAISVMDPASHSLAVSISEKLEAAGVVNVVDIPGKSMGHVRTDELGIPIAVVVYSTTSLKIRERDSNEEIPLPMENVVSVVKNLTDGCDTWGTFKDRTRRQQTFAYGEEQSYADGLDAFAIV